MATISDTHLIYNGWSKGAGGAWYYCPQGYSSTTHLHLGVSGSGSKMRVDFLSHKINDMGQGNIYLGGTGFSVSFADAIRDQLLATSFIKAVNNLNQGLVL